MVVTIKNKNECVIFAGIIVDKRGHDRKRTLYETNSALYEPSVRQGDSRYPSVWKVGCIATDRRRTGASGSCQRASPKIVTVFRYNKKT